MKKWTRSRLPDVINFVVLITVSILWISGRNSSCTSQTRRTEFWGLNLPTARADVERRRELILLFLLVGTVIRIDGRNLYDSQWQMITHTNAELTVTCNKKMMRIIGFINAMQLVALYCFALALGGTWRGQRKLNPEAKKDHPKFEKELGWNLLTVQIKGYTAFCLKITHAGAPPEVSVMEVENLWNSNCKAEVLVTVTSLLVGGHREQWWRVCRVSCRMRVEEQYRFVGEDHSSQKFRSISVADYLRSLGILGSEEKRSMVESYLISSWKPTVAIENWTLAATSTANQLKKLKSCGAKLLARTS